MTVDAIAVDATDAGTEPSIEAPVEAAADDTATVEPAEFEQTEEADPWESLKGKGYDPNQLEKSFTRFTQELEGVKAKERELAPYAQLKQMMDEDPRILASLERVLNEPLEGEDEVDVLRRELTSLKSGMATEREMSDLKQHVKAEGLPEVDDQSVLQYAIKHNLGSLRAAYNDMNVDAIRASEREKTLAEVKRGHTARAVTQTASASKATPAFTKEMIADMSSAEFIANQPAILAYYDSIKRG